MEVASLVGSIVSVVLAGFAIWISLYLYRLSSSAESEIKQSSKDIANGVSKLEDLFSSLYSDTFALVRDSYKAMHERAWQLPVEESAHVSIEDGLENGNDEEQVPLGPALPVSPTLPEAPEAPEVPVRHTQVRLSQAAIARRLGLTPNVVPIPGLESEPDLDQERLMELLSKAIDRAWTRKKSLPVHQLLVLGERAGFPGASVVAALFELQSLGRLYTAGRLGPKSEIYPTEAAAEEAREAREDQLLKEVIDDGIPF